jgi:hypothetical protein
VSSVFRHSPHAEPALDDQVAGRDEHNSDDERGPGATRLYENDAAERSKQQVENCDVHNDLSVATA